MTKKSVLFAIVLIVALSCVYAASVSADLKASPYSLQFIQRDDATFLSKYGYGFETGVRLNLKEAFCLGINVKYSSYSYNESKDNYQVLNALMPYVGCLLTINDKWTMTTDFGVGIQERILGDMRNFFVGLNLSLGVGYAVSEKIAITLGTDFGLCYQSESRDCSFDTMLGARFTL